MRIKELELFGFKSFAKKTRIRFEEGITAIVGPNGCGKSNIIDSIRWVIGEQRSKNLRGEKMEDLIFAGSVEKHSLSLAEVSLTLMDDDNKLPLDLGEIRITRRIYRSGEKEYFMNQKECRLKDITDLFLDTGVGKSAYSIMEQGKIDQILSSKPEERRLIFEEAAGIAKYKSRKHDAENKLKQTQENLSRLNDILVERTRQQDLLKRQADRAQRYKELKKVLRDEDTKIFLHRITTYQHQLNQTTQRKNTLDERWNNYLEDEKVLNTHREQFTEQLEALRHQLSTDQGEFTTLEKQMVEIEITAKHLTESIANKKEELAGYRRALRQIEEHSGQLHSVMDQVNRELESFLHQLEQLEQDQHQIQADLEEFLNHIDTNRLKIQQKKSQVKNLHRTIETLNFDLRKAIDQFIQAIDQASILIARNPSQASIPLADEIVQIQQEVEEIKALIPSAPLTEPSHVASLRQTLEAKMEAVLARLHSYHHTIQPILDIFLKSGGEYQKKKALDQEIKSTYQQIETMEQDIMDLDESTIDLLKEKDRMLEQQSIVHVSMAHMQEKTTHLEKDKSRIESELLTLTTRKEESEVQMETLADTLFAWEKQLVDWNIKKEALTIARNKLEGSFTELREKIKDLEKIYIQNESELIRKKEEMERIKKQLEQHQLNRRELEITIQTLRDHFIELRGETPESLLPEYDLTVFNQEESDQKKMRAKIELDQIGEVNLIALEEYNEIKKGIDFLNQQKQDIDQAIQYLQLVIQNTKREAEERFVTILKQIQENFQTIFQRLFGGGTTSIHLMQEDDVLESGIQINVQPPGKRLQSIMLLSGGEKTLTALAILFSIFKVRPSPFCLLDEVDAALDESNVRRFNLLLKDFRNETQFLVITHNRLTVASAQIIYGVTMEESGISKVLSIKVD